jgi:hypothetical protein
MKKIIFKLLLSAFFVQFFLPGNAQEVLKGFKQTIDFTVDELGDATVEVYMKLNASQWDMFKRSLGNNVSILKRSMETALPKSYLTDFSYAEEPMERAYKVKFKALGICSMNKNDMWVAKLDTKDPDITRLSDREFILNEDILMNGMVIQQTQKLHLPSAASGAKIEKDSFGKAVLTYKTGNSLMSIVLTSVGILLIASGAWLMYKNISGKKSKLVLVPIKAKEDVESHAV